MEKAKIFWKTFATASMTYFCSRTQVLTFWTTSSLSRCRRSLLACCLSTDRVCWGRLKHRHSRCALRRYLMFRRIVCVFRKSIKSVSFARKSSLRRFAWRRRYLSFRCELFERQFNRHSTFISRTLVHYNISLLLRYNFQPNWFIC